MIESRKGIKRKETSSLSNCGPTVRTYYVADRQPLYNFVIRLNIAADPSTLPQFQSTVCEVPFSAKQVVYYLSTKQMYTSMENQNEKIVKRQGSLATAVLTNVN